MKVESFCYWLQGFFELSKSESLTKEQTTMIKNHLNLVFKHDIDPSMGDKAHQEELNKIHHGFRIPTTEAEAIIQFGMKPSPLHLFGMHGWYHPSEEGLMRC